jgi:hypothetical protein
MLCAELVGTLARLSMFAVWSVATLTHLSLADHPVGHPEATAPAQVRQRLGSKVIHGHLHQELSELPLKD